MQATKLENVNLIIPLIIHNFNKIEILTICLGFSNKMNNM